MLCSMAAGIFSRKVARSGSLIRLCAASLPAEMASTMATGRMTTKISGTIRMGSQTALFWRASWMSFFAMVITVFQFIVPSPLLPPAG